MCIRDRYNAFLIAGLLIGGSLLYFAAVLLTHMLGFRLETNLRKRGIDGLTNASFRYFDLNSSGKTRKLIDDNAAQTHSIVAHLIPDNAGAILTPFLALVVGFLISLRAVSYTHLDVYKRQILMNLLICDALCTHFYYIRFIRGKFSWPSRIIMSVAYRTVVF